MKSWLHDRSIRSCLVLGGVLDAEELGALHDDAAAAGAAAVRARAAGRRDCDAACARAYTRTYHAMLHWPPPYIIYARWWVVRCD